jgi:hypothetical protein
MISHYRNINLRGAKQLSCPSWPSPRPTAVRGSLDLSSRDVHHAARGIRRRHRHELVARGRTVCHRDHGARRRPNGWHLELCGHQSRRSLTCTVRLPVSFLGSVDIALRKGTELHSYDSNRKTDYELLCWPGPRRAAPCHCGGDRT